MPAAFRTLCLERRSDSRLTAAERQAEVERVGQESAWLLDRLASTAGAALQVAAAVRTLATIWQQRYERVDGQVRWRDKTVDSTELIVTPHDPGVRAGQKRGRTWRGDKAPITETIAEPPTAADAGSAEPADPVRFITDVTTSPAPSGDGQALAEIREHRTERDLLPDEQVVDSGYVSGKHLAESEAAGVELIGPPLADTATNGFKLADFQIDRAARRAEPERQRAVRAPRRPPRRGPDPDLPRPAQNPRRDRGHPLRAGPPTRAAPPSLPRRRQAPPRAPAEGRRLQPQASRPRPRCPSTHRPGRRHGLIPTTPHRASFTPPARTPRAHDPAPRNHHLGSPSLPGHSSRKSTETSWPPRGRSAVLLHSRRATPMQSLSWLQAAR